MKLFKKIDFSVQVLMIIGFIVASFLAAGSTFILGYFIVGLWQITSMLVHYIKGWNSRKGGRRMIYTYVSAFTILLIAGAFILPQYLFAILYIMLFAAPLMAIYYTAICFHEVYYAEKRPSEVII